MMASEGMTGDTYSKVLKIALEGSASVVGFDSLRDAFREIGRLHKENLTQIERNAKAQERAQASLTKAVEAQNAKLRTLQERRQALELRMEQATTDKKIAQLERYRLAYEQTNARILESDRIRAAKQAELARQQAVAQDAQARVTTARQARAVGRVIGGIGTGLMTAGGVGIGIGAYAVDQAIKRQNTLAQMSASGGWSPQEQARIDANARRYALASGGDWSTFAAAQAAGLQQAHLSLGQSSAATRAFMMAGMPRGVGADSLMSQLSPYFINAPGYRNNPMALAALSARVAQTTGTPIGQLPGTIAGSLPQLGAAGPTLLPQLLAGAAALQMSGQDPTAINFLLRSVLASTPKRDKELAQIDQATGVNLAYDMSARGMAGPQALTRLFGDINRANLSPQTLRELFGGRGFSAASVLSGSGYGNFSNLASQYAAAGGQGQISSTFNRYQQLPTTEFARLKQTLSETSITIGTQLLPSVNLLLKSMVPWATAFAKFTAVHKDGIAEVLKWAPALLLFGGGIKAIGMAASAWSDLKLFASHMHDIGTAAASAIAKLRGLAAAETAVGDRAATAAPEEASLAGAETSVGASATKAIGVRGIGGAAGEGLLGSLGPLGIIAGLYFGGLALSDATVQNKQRRNPSGSNPIFAGGRSGVPIFGPNPGMGPQTYGYTPAQLAAIGNAGSQVDLSGLWKLNSASGAPNPGSFMPGAGGKFANPAGAAENRNYGWHGGPGTNVPNLFPGSIPVHGKLSDTDWGSANGADGQPIKLFGPGKWTYEGAKYDPDAGWFEMWKTPNGAPLGFWHVFSQSGNPVTGFNYGPASSVSMFNASQGLVPGHTYSAGRTVGYVGHPLTPAGGSGSHMCIVTDARGRSFIMSLTPQGQAQLKKQGYRVQPATLPQAGGSAGAPKNLPANVQRWWPQILAASAQTGVPPDVIAAYMAGESGGDPRKVSSAGALGLMQLMPGTAKGLGVNPNDNTQNILGGAELIQSGESTYGTNWGAIYNNVYNPGIQGTKYAGYFNKAIKPYITSTGRGNPFNLPGSSTSAVDYWAQRASAQKGNVDALASLGQAGDDPMRMKTSPLGGQYYKAAGNYAYDLWQGDLAQINSMSWQSPAAKQNAISIATTRYKWRIGHPFQFMFNQTSSANLKQHDAAYWNTQATSQIDYMRTVFHGVSSPSALHGADRQQYVKVFDKMAYDQYAQYVWTIQHGPGSQAYKSQKINEATQHYRYRIAHPFAENPFGTGKGGGAVGHVSPIHQIGSNHCAAETANQKHHAATHLNTGKLVTLGHHHSVFLERIAVAVEKMVAGSAVNTSPRQTGLRPVGQGR